MYLEALSVCVDYSDFLAHTLPHNRPHFDRWVIVTAPHDRATQRLCAHFHVECVVTEAFYRGGDRFNKGCGINAGLSRLRKHDWLVHIDADIVLPPRTREFLQATDLDPLCIYGIDRLMCRDFDSWANYQRQPVPQFQNEVFVQLKPFPIGTRVAKLDAGGYVPIGFFQLWNAASHRLNYPQHHSTAARSDMLFSLQWERRRRQLLPEIVGIHLATDAAGAIGANWNGRTTPGFGPTVCDTQVSGYE